MCNGLQSYLAKKCYLNKKRSFNNVKSKLLPPENIKIAIYLNRQHLVNNACKARFFASRFALRASFLYAQITVAVRKYFSGQMISMPAQRKAIFFIFLI